jgi:hypothetical protein
MRLRAAIFLAPLLGLSFLLVLPAPAMAQRKLWGVTVSFAPIFETASFSKYLNNAEELTLKGQELRVGVYRGGTVRGDWSLLYVQRPLNAGGVVNQDGVPFTTNDDVVLDGFEVEKFAVVGDTKDRVLYGVVVGVGVAFVRGTMTAPDGSTVNAKDVLTLFGTDIKLQPMFRLEFGLGIVVARGFRIRGSAGFDWPGYSASIGATYLFGDR